MKKLGWIIWSVAISSTATPLMASPTSSSSVGEAGVDVLRLHASPYNLIGRKIAIGQVEIGRPGFFGLDKAVSWRAGMNSPAGGIAIERVFYRNEPAKPDTDVDSHAGMVAGVMVSRDKTLPGVAPGARLYSSAVGSPEMSGQAEECLSSQYIAGQNGGDVRAINFSFGESLQRDGREEAILDGNALLTQCIDWSSRTQDVLYVIAGNQGGGGIPIPTDHYNGITTAFTTRRNGVFTKVDFPNISAQPEGVGSRLIRREINAGERRAINLVAPGGKVSVYELDGKIAEVSGTSFAAPHITASVAVLQEFGDRQLSGKQPNWSLDSRRHQVMKAVLLNSADKIQDNGDGLSLGMSRTVLGKDNSSWLDSDAYKDEKIPLDMQMGTGHLNVFRAYQQFSPGQWSPTGAVPPIGWDYFSVEDSSHRDYALEKPLKAGSFVSLTLAWDRVVELEDKNGNEMYDIGEKFRDRGLNNLDLYLIPVDEEDSDKSVCASVSEVDSIEHVFCQVKKAGRYKIRVEYRDKVNEKSQSYGLAWWTVSDR
ncbi:MAG TPA: peptidase S8 and S53 subtilisin kexin sedolisin [Cyanobacteria bacterium UBA11149]|nr:peptidase S8 and S53 subtilisin kexin sedolisin [Cyanobacteria bacterium UBA11367]HBE57812.1 peptidase S8 and S53 subtilisin kexin sedolisin [Cyanobacteria bacterium UBA11366]HBK62507.1 peptidase S8 and S53 subtilisin kexin sedolisin [Cyanobacteria bacterium UBA11166]HBR72797.1 peptidase S8 and S53 subtilisin kexin sedolisin [Cyanobacteria bacterium UBA11159]HBS71669.1 peptidase S8 and S53 subtilisin kexin sedolisin [Cyanobacteria bacterium UBA11153]HBW90983.1 peptidase S8 and S53 subtilisi